MHIVLLTALSPFSSIPMYTVHCIVFFIKTEFTQLQVLQIEKAPLRHELIYMYCHLMMTDDTALVHEKV